MAPIVAIVRAIATENKVFIADFESCRATRLHAPKKLGTKIRLVAVKTRTMQPNIIALEEIQIAQPCRADWNRMTGDQRARFCGSCHKNVYDISQMTRAQAQQLIQEKEGDVCLRLHRRPDGTVITSDCPVGIAATPRPLWWGVAALTALIGAGLAGCATQSETIGDIAPVATLGEQTTKTPPVAPVKFETPPRELGEIQPVPITNGLAPSTTHSGVTMGAPLRPQPTPKSASTPQPTNAPLMGEPTLNHTAMGVVFPPTPTREKS